MLVALGVGCAAYANTRAATSSIWDVRVTTSPDGVADCRLIDRVDSRDSARGCGLTVQPTAEECLRYQVKRAGGDTLLRKGPAGNAYDCSGHAVGAPETARGDAATAASAQPSAAPRAQDAPAIAPVPIPASAPPSPEARPAARVRVTRDRESAKGCVYLGDVSARSECPDEGGEALGGCSTEAVAAGGDIILLDGVRAQIFSCAARPRPEP